MKSIAEILKSKGITEETRFHNYKYLYEMMKTCCDEYGRQFCKPDVNGSLPLYAVNRVEVIDEAGRSYVNWHSKNSVHADLQDEGRTLKVFVSKRQ